MIGNMEGTDDINEVEEEQKQDDRSKEQVSRVSGMDGKKTNIDVLMEDEEDSLFATKPKRKSKVANLETDEQIL